MTESEALDALSLLIAAGHAPTLTTLKCGISWPLPGHRGDGHSPDDDAWTPTWNLRAVVRRG